MAVYMVATLLFGGGMEVDRRLVGGTVEVLLAVSRLPV